jgi:hypothetical protein
LIILCLLMRTTSRVRAHGFEETKLKLKRIILAGLCSLMLTGMSSVLSIGICQQSEGTGTSGATPAQQTAPASDKEEKTTPPETSAEAKAKAPEPRKAEDKKPGSFEATETCAGG